MTIELHAVYIAVIVIVSYVIGLLTAALRRRKGQKELDFMLRALGAYIVDKCFDGDETAAQADIQKWIAVLLQDEQGGKQ